METPFVGEIGIFGFGFAPKGWAQCNGQLMAINQNQALFSLLGTTFGGDGRTTFGLPDLRGRAAAGVGQGPGLSNYVEGEMTGATSHTLILTEMPAHTHTVNCNSGGGTSQSPGGNVWAADGSFTTDAYAPYANVTPMAPGAVAANSGGQPHENRQPVLTVNICIALTGVFPSRN